MRRSALLLLCTLLVVAGCGARQSGGGAESETYTEREGKLLVFASFFPMADFTEKLTGERAEVRTLVPEGMEPHDWEPTFADIAGFTEADLLVYSGAGLEPWIGTVLDAPGDMPAAVEASAGVALLGEASGAATDPHVWLDPNRAKAQMRNICDALVQVDPEGAEAYRENLEHWSAELDKLDGEFRAVLDDLPRREIIVAHAAFGYLCEAYGLTQVAVQGFSPDSEPGPAQMAALVDHVRESGTKVIFFEDAASPKIAEAIARETGAKTAVLSPLEMLGAEKRTAGADYFSAMRENLRALADALAE